MTTGDDPATPGEAADEQVYVFPAHLLPVARAQIDKANRRLQRAGIGERFTFEHTQFLQPDPRTPAAQRAMTRLRLNHPAISLAGWTFVATLVHEDGAVIVRAAPGQTVGGPAPADPRCDHCRSRRNRRDTYLVRNTDGQIKQVGSNCLAAFLGVRPAGLWALGFELDRDELSGDDGEAAAAADLRVPTRHILAHALAVSDHGRDYRSRARYEVSTADIVTGVLFDTPQDSEEAAHNASIAAAAAAILAEGSEIDAVLATGRDLPGDGDYAHNAHAIAGLEWIDRRNIPLACSLVAVHYRELARRAQRASWAAGFLGEPGQRLAEVPATVVSARLIQGHYQDCTLIIMQTPDGHCLKWFASGDRDVEPGQHLHVTGRIKATEQWQGIDQTIITRARLTPTENPCPAA